ncbi:MAG: chemotaxis protein [Bacteroidetes bacterium]|nr:chemotaxis protein [Bacteroidota bacterium]
MNWKNFKIGQKLAIGFGLLIIISAALGTIAVVNMSNISTKSTYLAEEYVPEVEVSNNVERHSLLTMFNMRGYGYTEEEQFLESGREELQLVKDYLKDAQELAQNSSQLVKLQSAVDEVSDAVNKYEELVNRTVALNKKLEEDRTLMDENASIFIKNCASYLDSQNESFNREAQSNASAKALQERNSKITWINDIIDKGNAVRVANFKGQATRDPVGYKQAIDNFSIEAELSNLRSVTRLAADKEALNNVENSADEYLQSMKDFLKNWEEREAVAADRVVQANIVLDGSKNTALAGVEHTSEIAQEAVALLGSSSTVMIVGLVIALIIGVILAYIITQSITNGIKKGVGFATVVSEGDLTVNIESEYLNRNDEIGALGKALQAMVEKLRDIVVNIISGAENIASASQQMSSTSQQMSQGANEQASSAEEVSSSMEEMVSNIQQNTDNAQSTEKIAVKATDGIKQGNESTKISVDSMKQIAEKITIVNDIAFQTNILALNAAVEAARAGEHGKGFAVVAAEVRKLAERSKIAADEIDELSKNGVAISEKAGQQLEEIVPEIEKTAKLVQEIAAASIEQNSGADQVNNAIQQLNQVTQQNAAASEEMATSSEELSSQADQLKELISYFKVDSQRKVKSIEQKLHSDNTKKKEKPAVAHMEKTPKKGAEIKLEAYDSKDEEYEKF